MGFWTRMLQYKEIINGRAVMVETKQACYYQYLIFPTNEVSFEENDKIIRSGYNYTSALAAFHAGKKYAKLINTL